jgi:hypothetical protein
MNQTTHLSLLSCFIYSNSCLSTLFESAISHFNPLSITPSFGVAVAPYLFFLGHHKDNAITRIVYARRDYWMEKCIGALGCHTPPHLEKYEKFKKRF